jgi:hypothetical protein
LGNPAINQQSFSRKPKYYVHCFFGFDFCFQKWFSNIIYHASFVFKQKNNKWLAHPKCSQGLLWSQALRGLFRIQKPHFIEFSSEFENETFLCHRKSRQLYEISCLKIFQKAKLDYYFYFRPFLALFILFCGTLLFGSFFFGKGCCRKCYM